MRNSCAALLAFYIGISYVGIRTSTSMFLSTVRERGSLVYFGKPHDEIGTGDLPKNFIKYCLLGENWCYSSAVYSLKSQDCGSVGRDNQLL